MKWLLICLLGAATSAHAKTTSINFGLDERVAIVNAALDYTLSLHPHQRSQALNDLQNLTNLPEMSVGSSFDFGTILTLRKFDCAEMESGLQFECKLMIQYCIQQDEYPPAIKDLVIRGTRDLQITSVESQENRTQAPTCH